MKRRNFFPVGLSAIVLSILIGVTLGRYSSRILAAQMPGAACSVSMANIIQSAKGDVYEIDDPNYIEPKSYSLVTYSVHGDEITNPVYDPIPNDLKDEQKNSALQNQAWQIFVSLIPPPNREIVKEFNVFTDGYSNTLAASDQTKEDLSEWVLEVDIADLEDNDALMFTMIHEYGHILTLNASQMDPDQEIMDDPLNPILQKEKAAACPNYFTGMGCSHADAYIQSFYDRFWVDIIEEWKKIDALQYDADLDPYYEGLFNFYLAHQDQFLDDYSTTHVTEDIAESFAYFVFGPKPGGTSIKGQKVLFFYAYPELIKLRQSILQGACSILQ